MHARTPCILFARSRYQLVGIVLVGIVTMHTFMHAFHARFMYAILHAFVSISMHAFHARFSCTNFMHRWPDLRDADVVPILTFHSNHPVAGLGDMNDAGA